MRIFQLPAKRTFNCRRKLPIELRRSVPTLVTQVTILHRKS